MACPDCCRPVRRPVRQAVRIAVVLAVVGLTRAALADPGVVTWPTYFRTGPGDRFVVIEELATGEAVDVQSCTDHWCKVQIAGVPGYVERANLGQTAPPSMFPPPTPQQQAGCFDSRRAGYEDGDVFRYCPR